MVKSITQNTFHEEVLLSGKPVLVDFYATWCGPCKMLSPVLEALSSDTPDYVVAKIDVDSASTLAEEFKVVSVPTLLLFENGVLKNRTSGYQSKEALLDFMKQN